MISFLATQLPRPCHADRSLSAPLGMCRSLAARSHSRFPIPHSPFPFPFPIFPFPLLFSFSSSHSCSSSPRLIALISSDSDYCCLRIVQLMCELRHCLKRRSTTRIRFRLRLATKLSSRIGIDFKCECETSTILVWLAGWLAVSARQLLQSLFTAGRLAFSTQI